MALTLKQPSAHTVWKDVVKATLATAPESVDGFDVRRMAVDSIDKFDADKLNTYRSAMERTVKRLKLDAIVTTATEGADTFVVIASAPIAK